MIIESEGGGLCSKSRRRTFTDTVLQNSDNRFMSALHGGPVLCNPQILVQEMILGGTNRFTTKKT